MVLQIVCGYLALAAFFYIGMLMTATERDGPIVSHRHKWQRARRIKDYALLRRIRPLLIVRVPRLPKRPRT